MNFTFIASAAWTIARSKCRRLKRTLLRFARSLTER